MNRAEAINMIAKKINAKSYLEIGVQTGKTFRAVDMPFKIGVDPDPQWVDQTHLMGSDQFFSMNKQTFDIIFVDGLHHREQVYRDINNALKVLNDGGVILVDDCAPKKEAYQTSNPTAIHWTGDVWRAWLRIRGRFSSWKTCTYDIEFGLGCMYEPKEVQNVDREYREQLMIAAEKSYQEFNDRFEELLDLKTTDDFCEDWK